MSLKDTYEDTANRHPLIRRWPPLSAVLVLFLLLTTPYGLFFIQTRSSGEMILNRQYATALISLHRWKWLPFVSGTVYEKIGTIELLRSNPPEAFAYFQLADKKFFTRPISIWRTVLQLLWTQAKYREGLAYVDHIFGRVPGEKVLHFYRAGFLAGLHQPDKAMQELKAAGNLPELADEIAALKREVEHRLATGNSAFLYDRNNLPLVNLSTAGEPAVAYESIRSVLRSDSGDYLTTLAATPHLQADLTIDYRIQQAAMQALGNYAGAIVLLNPKTGEILAAASNPTGVRSKHSSETPIALNKQYEPGSIIKMITLAGASEKGIRLDTIFPLQCDGFLVLSEKRILYDWKAHGTVNDAEVATAVSCNVSFAKLGLAMKPEDLLSNLRRFGFDDVAREAFLPIELGKIIPGEINDHYVSKLSIGLDYVRMTPLHAAMTASAIANGGVAMNPRLIRNHRNIIGIPFGTTPSVPFRRLMSEKTAQLLARAMKQVIDHPEGTGRRAAVANFPIAMKTGTAGEGAKGYDAFLIGFGPLQEPRVAFAIFIEHCGKAEYEGARITRLFLESIQGYI